MKDFVLFMTFCINLLSAEQLLTYFEIICVVYHTYNDLCFK